VSSAFAILPASTSIELDPTRGGSASFTVTNQLGRPVRVRVEVTPAGDKPAPKEWLTPPAEPERDLATDGSEQFKVLVAVPDKVAGGTYTFRLDAVSTELPDEEWAHSPEVHFLVPDPAPDPQPEPQKPPPPMPKGYIESAAGALLGGFAGGLGVGVIGVIALVLASGLPTTSSGDPLKDIFNTLGTAIVLAVLVMIVVLIAIWVGAATGIYLFLKSRGFPDPGRTALPAAVILPVWATVLLFLLSKLNIDLPGVVGLVLTLVLAIVVIVVPALAGRAIFRFRTTGGL
jgi:hypothetical protein